MAAGKRSPLSTFGKIGMLALNVDDLDEAVKFYSALFEEKFDRFETELKEGKVRWAIGPRNFELVERVGKKTGSDAIRSFHFRVHNVTEVRENLKKKGFEPYEEGAVGNLRELMYNIRGLRIVFIDYRGRPKRKKR
jgi:predicted enzyme related to lactoylglutathione lyase